MSIPSRGFRPALLLTAILALAACEESDSDPLMPESPVETSAVEATLDLAAATVSATEDQLIRQAERDARQNDGRRDGQTDGVRDRLPASFDRVGLVVELSGTAVSLAGRILDEQGLLSEEHKRLFKQAQEFQRLAEAALRAGNPDRAVHFAIQACWTALKAVILPGGVTEEEVRFIYDLATELIKEAVESVGDDPTALEKQLLQWSAQFYVAGEDLIDSGHVRGVAWLWKSAVISAYVIG